MFTIFQNSRTVRHIDGLNFHPRADTLSPGEGTPVYLMAGIVSASKFAARYDTEQMADVHGEKIIGGYWNLLI